MLSTVAHNCHNNNKKKNNVKKENLTNKKVLLPYKQDLLTCTKKDLLTYFKNSLQIATTNSHSK